MVLHSGAIGMQVVREHAQNMAQRDNSPDLPPYTLGTAQRAALPQRLRRCFVLNFFPSHRLPRSPHGLPRRHRLHRSPHVLPRRHRLHLSPFVINSSATRGHPSAAALPIIPTNLRSVECDSTTTRSVLFAVKLEGVTPIGGNGR